MLLFSCLASLLLNVASELSPEKISYDNPVPDTNTFRKSEPKIECPDQVRYTNKFMCDFS